MAFAEAAEQVPRCQKDSWEFCSSDRAENFFRDLRFQRLILELQMPAFPGAKFIFKTLNGLGSKCLKKHHLPRGPACALDYPSHALLQTQLQTINCGLQ